MAGASTHPGGGVHGAAGSNAARVLLGDLRLQKLTDGIDSVGHALMRPGQWGRSLAPSTVGRKIGQGARTRW